MWAVDLLSDSVMEKQYLNILGLISEIEEQQNIHSILVLRNVCGGDFPNYSLYVSVATFTMLFFWD